MTKSSTRVAIGIAAGASIFAIAAPALAQQGGADDIVVTAQRNNQTKVTAGGNAGVFGAKAAEDIPFNIRSYNEALILNQQPDSLGEVLENDPTIRTALGFGIAGEVFVIRGFDLSSDDVGFDGLYGITPRQIVAPELASSVQVINGASAFLNGAAPGGSGIGGSVNILPKRPSATSSARPSATPRRRICRQRSMSRAASAQATRGACASTLRRAAATSRSTMNSTRATSLARRSITPAVRSALHSASTISG